jgi:hypothetical protein
MSQINPWAENRLLCKVTVPQNARRLSTYRPATITDNVMV